MALTPLFKELWSFLVFWDSKIRFTIMNLVDPSKIQWKISGIWFFFKRYQSSVLLTQNHIHTSLMAVFLSCFCQIHSRLMDFFGILLCFFHPENGVSSKKVQKTWKSKNGVKTALTPLFKELWAIFGYLIFKNQIY